MPEDDQPPSGPPSRFTPLPPQMRAAPPSASGRPPRRGMGRGVTRLVLASFVIGALGLGAYVVVTASSEPTAPTWTSLEGAAQRRALTGLCASGTPIDVLPASPGAAGVVVTPTGTALVSLDAAAPGAAVDRRVATPGIAVCVTDVEPDLTTCPLGLGGDALPVVTGATFTSRVVRTHSGEVVDEEDGTVASLGCPATPPELVGDDDLPAGASTPPRFHPEVIAAMVDQAQQAAISAVGG